MTAKSRSSPLAVLALVAGLHTSPTRADEEPPSLAAYRIKSGFVLVEGDIPLEIEGGLYLPPETALARARETAQLRLEARQRPTVWALVAVFVVGLAVGVGVTSLTTH